MEILTLSIKQKFFDQIKAGVKKNEVREIRTNTEKKYLNFDNQDNIVDLIKYDAIKFVTGQYKGTRPSMVVEVKKAELFWLTDENDEQITYMENGVEMAAGEIEYTLGKIYSQP